jgi:3-isopropylmalate/(R)-2-methylmalate dehydratase small subunit
VLNPDFVLNQYAHQGAQILLSGANFGCGSSREHAPWALADFGFKVIIAESFADIFFANCVNNQLLLVSLPRQMLYQLSQQVKERPTETVRVDLASQRISTWGAEFSFMIDEKLKRQLMQGLDRIGITLEKLADIQAYENALPAFMRTGHAAL